MKYELNFRNNRDTDEELLADMKKVAEKLRTDKLTMKDYDEFGKFSSPTVKSRFGSWNTALEKVGLVVTVYPNTSEKELFENLEEVWIKLGKQPQRRDMKRPVSKYSERGYITKYGSLTKALEAFVEFINSATIETDENLTEEITPEAINETELVFKHKTKRQPSERLKVQVQHISQIRT